MIASHDPDIPMDDLLDYDEDNPAPDIPPAATARGSPFPLQYMAHQQMLPQSTRRLTSPVSALRQRLLKHQLLSITLD